MLILLYNAKIILPDSIVCGFVIVRDEKIESVGEGSEYPRLSYDREIDVKNNYLAPGFIEVHTHGAAGASFLDGTVEAFEKISDMQLRHGTTTLVPSPESSSFENTLRCIEVFRAAKEKLAGKTLHLHGLHMEGPYLSVHQLGGMDPAYVRNPDPKEYEVLLSAGKGLICRWTVAPEIEGARAFIERLLEEGIQPSIGHSNAEYSQVKAAFDWGVRQVTHLYSTMSTIVRRSGFRISGVLESAFCIPDMTVEMIADGCHLPPELLNMVYRLKGPEHVVLISDSMNAAGSEAKEVPIGNGRIAIVEDGVLKLPDRSCFAGSIALDDRLVRVMNKKADVPLWDAVRMLTLTPAQMLGIDKETGSIMPGKTADLITFDEDINILSVMVSGKQLVSKEIY